MDRWIRTYIHTYTYIILALMHIYVDGCIEKLKKNKEIRKKERKEERKKERKKERNKETKKQRNKDRKDRKSVV